MAREPLPGQNYRCIHCGGYIHSTQMIEFGFPRTEGGMGDRAVLIWTHNASGHERCLNGVTYAEPSDSEPYR